MSTVILDAFETENSILPTVKKLLEEKKEHVYYFKLKETNILPCRSCGACGFKSPGKCVLNDDIHEIMKAIAKSSLYIMMTPIRFGGYSSHLKKVVDRTMPMGLPLYFVRDGYMLHPMRYGHKHLLNIGLVEENIHGQEENFKLLVERNAINMQFTPNTLVFRPDDSIQKIHNGVYSALREVI